MSQQPNGTLGQPSKRHRGPIACLIARSPAILPISCPPRPSSNNHQQPLSGPCKKHQRLAFALHGATKENSRWRQRPPDTQRDERFASSHHKPLDSALSSHKADFPGGPECPTSGQLPAGLGAVEFQRGFRSHKWCPHLPGSPVNHVALIGMPEVDLWGRKAS